MFSTLFNLKEVPKCNSFYGLPNGNYRINGVFNIETFEDVFSLEGLLNNTCPDNEIKFYLYNFKEGLSNVSFRYYKNNYSILFISQSQHAYNINIGNNNYKLRYNNNKFELSESDWEYMKKSSNYMVNVEETKKFNR